MMTLLWMMVTIAIVGLCSGMDWSPTIDMTHVVNADTFAWPTATKFKHTQVYRGAVVQSELPDPIGAASNEYWYENNDISSSEHSGTHTDAPAHFSKGSWRVDQIPLNRLSGPAVKVDISQKVEEQWNLGNKDVTLSVTDLTNWEDTNGNIPDGAILVVHTGHGKHYDNRTRYLGRPEGETFPENDARNLHFPGVSKEAAAWLVENRKIVGLGIDTPSMDPGNSRLFEVHQILNGKNIWGLENLALTDELPTTGYIIYNFVYKIEGGSGGPSRVFAFDPRSVGRSIRDADATGGSDKVQTVVTMGLVIIVYIGILYLDFN